MRASLKTVSLCNSRVGMGFMCVCVHMLWCASCWIVWVACICFLRLSLWFVARLIYVHYFCLLCSMPLIFHYLLNSLIYRLLDVVLSNSSFWVTGIGVQVRIGLGFKSFSLHLFPICILLLPLVSFTLSMDICIYTCKTRSHMSECVDNLTYIVEPMYYIVWLFAFPAPFLSIDG